MEPLSIQIPMWTLHVGYQLRLQFYVKSTRKQTNAVCWLWSGAEQHLTMKKWVNFIPELPNKEVKAGWLFVSTCYPRPSHPPPTPTKDYLNFLAPPHCHRQATASFDNNCQCHIHFPNCSVAPLWQFAKSNANPILCPHEDFQQNRLPLPTDKEREGLFPNLGQPLVCLPNSTPPEFNL